MPICYRRNCLFVHIPRTGGTSIEQALGIHREWPQPDLEVLHGRLVLGSEEYQMQHLSFTEMAQFVSADWLAGCFSFAFSRNPWDRLLSAYCWAGVAATFGEYVHWACEVVRTRQELAGRHCHLRPQVEFIDAPVSFVGRFESFARDVEVVFSRIGLKPRPILQSSATVHDCYSDYYTDETRKLVAKMYEADVDRFKYVF
jgi:chondroitin 4-sulfotransferase 11